ncbi:hypothetical protein SCG7086_AA_00660 [Chlamydiales bacterium SCGC AG-110-P3]|nr:hypothetical protein SCG7086_AA_00660 [Chlamydiales bacterium SCGC AG-110-P3]
MILMGVEAIYQKPDLSKRNPEHKIWRGSFQGNTSVGREHSKMTLLCEGR